jgi:ribosomal protein L16 Arg81 hydroxylase
VTGPVEDRLSLDWELWVVEHLLFTAARDRLVDVLVEQGLPGDVARDQLARIEQSRGLAGLRARVAEAALADRLERLRTELVADHPIPVLADVTPDELLERFWIPGRPVVLTQAARGIEAVSSWTLPGLSARFPDATVQVNVGRAAAQKPSDTEQRSARVPLPEYVARCLAGPTNDTYAVSRNGWLADPALRALWDDLRPLPPLLAPSEPPRGVAMWVGPAGTVTPAHFDPHNVLLVQVQGTKVVRLAPRLRARLAARLDGYYLAGTLDEVFGAGLHTVHLGPGDALFLPAGWFHEVTATAPSITLSFLSFPWPNHFHFVGPTGSDDR